jgi:hypothetical protein
MPTEGGTMRRIYYRTVRNNRIKLLGKILGNENLKNGELDGKRFCFIPYKDYAPNSGFSFNGLTALWGTEAYSKALNKETEGAIDSLSDEDGRILAPDGKIRWYFWTEIKEEHNG